MATLAELSVIAGSNVLIDKITAAVAIQADIIRAEATSVPNHANRLLWAKSAFTAPRAIADHMQWAILATNRAATSSQITGADDTSIQSAVAAVVDIFANGS